MKYIEPKQLNKIEISQTMALNFSKEFVENQKRLNKTSQEIEIKNFSSIYDEVVLSRNKEDLKILLDDLNPLGSSAIYLSNYSIQKNALQKNGIFKEIFFENNKSIIEWLHMHFKFIQSCGGLEIFIELEKLKNASILLHYQGDIIIKTKKLNSKLP